MTKLDQAGEDKTLLEQAKRELQQKLLKLGVEIEALKTEKSETDYGLPIFKIKTIPVSTNPKVDGVFRIGGNSLERTNKIITIDEGETSKLKKLIITQMPEIFRLDLKGCVNLEKLSIRDSKWDNIVNAKECPKLKKVSIKRCEWTDNLAFLNGTEVEEVKII